MQEEMQVDDEADDQKMAELMQHMEWQREEVKLKPKSAPKRKAMPKSAESQDF